MRKLLFSRIRERKKRKERRAKRIKKGRRREREKKEKEREKREEKEKKKRGKGEKKEKKKEKKKKKEKRERRGGGKTQLSSLGLRHRLVKGRHLGSPGGLGLRFWQVLGRPGPDFAGLQG